MRSIYMVADTEYYLGIRILNFYVNIRMNRIFVAALIFKFMSLLSHIVLVPAMAVRVCKGIPTLHWESGLEPNPQLGIGNCQSSCLTGSCIYPVLHECSVEQSVLLKTRYA